MNGYFIDTDADGALWVWRAADRPVPVLSRWELRHDPELWDAIAALVEGAS